MVSNSETARSTVILDGMQSHEELKELKSDRQLKGRQRGNYRQAKPWYGKTFYAERMKLMEILSAKYARKGVLAIVENVDDNAEKWERRQTRLINS